MLALWKKSCDQPRQHIKKQRQYFANITSQSYDFSICHVRMWEMDCEESWVPKNWCFWTVVLEETLDSLLDCKEIQPVNPNGNQSRIFIGRTDGEAETSILWPPYAKNQLFGKDPDARKDWKWEEKGQQRMRWLDGITNVMDMSLHASGNWWWTGKPGILKAMGWQRIGQNWVTESTEMTDKNSATRVVRTIE